MKENITIEGSVYRIRPVTVNDSLFIIKLRTEDLDRNKYINPISTDTDLQKKWLEEYLHKKDDLYFVVENVFTNDPEGLIGIYNISNGRAEWGRWVISQGSLAATESVNLIFQVAFEKLNLREVYSRTISENKNVISFHESLPQKRRCELLRHFEINNEFYNATEHFVDKEYYYKEIVSNLKDKIDKILSRSIKKYLGGFEFHHIGVASQDIMKDYFVYHMLGYKKEGVFFEDKIQGVKGQFLIANNQPRLEILENLEGSNTLNKWLESGVKNYHFAYRVEDIEKVVDFLTTKRFRVVSSLKMSIYFKKRICFMVMPNRFMIELIEK
jgi:RimJ/RimL family protein N-acetyltransferase